MANAFLLPGRFSSLKNEIPAGTFQHVLISGMDDIKREELQKNISDS